MKRSREAEMSTWRVSPKEWGAAAAAQLIPIGTWCDPSPGLRNPLSSVNAIVFLILLAVSFPSFHLPPFDKFCSSGG